MAYPCFRFRITGHYFALVTLALSGIVLQIITATRDYTGGSLGYTPERTKGSHIVALQFDDKVVWYLIALGVWAAGLLIWRWVDRSMDRYALEAISEDEDAAAAAGVNVTFEKLKITVISALMTALAGALYGQYQMFISPDTVSGIAVSLQMVFAVVVGGIYVALGPTVGAIITIMLAEGLRIGFGTKAVGWDNLVYGVLLVAVHHLPSQGHSWQLARAHEVVKQAIEWMSSILSSSGPGSSGAPIVDRLTASGRHSVLLLEAGPDDNANRWLSIPLGFAKTFLDPDVNWKFATEPEAELDGRRIYWPRGKVVGGSSAINGMVYVRGLPSDYDRWRQMGNPGWSFDDCLPYFKRLEAYPGGASDLHGGDGPVKITQDEYRNEIGEAFLAACAEVGLPSTCRLQRSRRRRARACITPPSAAAAASRPAGPISRRPSSRQLPRRDRRAGRAHRRRRRTRDRRRPTARTARA